MKSVGQLTKYTYLIVIWIMIQFLQNVFVHMTYVYPIWLLNNKD